ncbi:MAG TPA: methylcrotonoyl-CoA carboxylase, partial [Candidatus Poseidoniales archaeon]|nr:methylcrotonoyl-CoA carboxylase [Candidatus Poseidoniales archaeon]
MDRLQSRVNTGDALFKSNHEHNSALLATLRKRLEAVQEGGGGKYVDKHRSRGKALARERISAICDP